LLNITPNIQQTKLCNLFFLRQGQNGLFILDLTSLSDKNEQKAIEEMKVHFGTVQGSKKKGMQKRTIFSRVVRVKSSKKNHWTHLTLFREDMTDYGINHSTWTLFHKVRQKRSVT